MGMHRVAWPNPQSRGAMRTRFGKGRQDPEKYPTRAGLPLGNMKAWVLFWSMLLLASTAQAQQPDYYDPAAPVPAEEQRPAPKKERTPPEEPKNFKDRLRLGGNLGLQFGTYTYIDVSPMVGVVIYRGLQAGIGVTYQYLRVADSGARFESHTYGGRVYGRYIIWKGIMAHAEFEMLNLDCYDRGLYASTGQVALQREWVPGALIGGGYYQAIGQKFGTSILLLFNLLQSECTPYANPVFRLGFGFRL